MWEKLNNFTIGDNFIDGWVDKKLDQYFGQISEKIASKMTNFLVVSVDTILALIAIGIYGYLVWLCIRYMFMGKNMDLQKIMLAGFLLLLVRIANVILIFRLGG